MSFSGQISLPGLQGSTRTNNRQTNYASIVKEKTLNDFQRMCYLKDRHTTMPGEGRSVEITSRGLATATTTLPSELGNFRPPTPRIFGKRVIALEHEKKSITMISDWDRMQRDPQYRDDLAFDTGATLARQWDSAVLIKIMQGGLTATSTLNETFAGGARVTLDKVLTATGAAGTAATTQDNVSGPQLVKAAVQLSAEFDKDNVPRDLPRYFGVTTTDHGNMVTDKVPTVQNPIDTRVGGMGNIADAELMRVGNMGVISLRNLAELRINIEATNKDWGTTATTGNQPWVNSMVGNYSKVVAVAWNPDAVCTAIWGGPYSDVRVQPKGGGSDAFLAAIGSGFALATFYYGTQVYREACCGVVDVK